MNIAVVMGGFSGEAQISLKSGNFILDKLDKNKYTSYKVIIQEDRWYVDFQDEKYSLDKNDFSFEYNSKKIKFDLVVNTIHGTPGEDGQMQAYWNLIHLPYTGCNHYLSALTFNKRDTLSVLRKFDIPMAKSYYIDKGEIIDENEIIKNLNLPLIVKPNQAGSSLGISKVEKIKEFKNALEFAFKEDDQILIESFLNGTEVSVGVFKIKNEIKVIGITEIVSENSFFDYEAKYLGKSNEITPARISEQEKGKVELISKKIYESLNMKGFSRIDFIIVEGIPHFIEINTNPGLSPQSIFPQQVEKAKLEFSDLLDELINQTLT